MTQAEFNKSNNEVNNDLDYNLDDIRFELSQICAILDIVTDTAIDIYPMTAEIDKIGNSLRLIRQNLNSTYSRLEVLLGFSSPNQN